VVRPWTRLPREVVESPSLEGLKNRVDVALQLLDTGKKFFPMRVVRPWPRLPREAVAAPSLAVLKARLDGALSTLVWWKMSLLMAGGLEPDDL